MRKKSSIELPDKPGEGPNAFADVKNAGDFIVAEWNRRHQLDRLSPQESANGFFKREAYRFICHYIERGKAEFFESVIRRNGGGLSSVVKLEENPFHYGLAAMFPAEAALNRADRSVYSSQMVYAYRHAGSPHLLVGFIYQCGSTSELRRKLKAGEIEPGFEGQYRKSFAV